MKAILLTTMLAYLGGNIYLFICTLQQMASAPSLWKVIFSIIFWLCVVALFIAIGARNIALPEILARALFQIGSAWMVFLLYMVILLLVTDLAHLIYPSFNGFYYALGFTLCLLIYGYWNYGHPNVNMIEISLEKPLSKPFRVVATSDIHLGYGTNKKRLKQYVDLINEQQPDAVVISGDLIDNSIKPVEKHRMEEELQEINAPYGVYMVMGNHEYISGREECEKFINSAGITLLRDSMITLSNGVQIIGRDDRSNHQRKSLEELIAECNNAMPMILLDHQPYLLSQTDALKIDLQISGHTHRGQIFPINLLTDHIYEQSHGYRQWNHSHIVVSSGLSLWGPPFRIGTNSDIYVIQINGNKKD